MSTFTRPRTKRQQRHSASRSDSHIADKQQAEARREVTYVPVPASGNDVVAPSLEARGLRGSERIYRDGVLTECADPEEFADYIEERAKSCGWFYQPRMKRGKQVEVRRQDPTPLTILTVTAAPWVNAWIDEQLAAGKDMNAFLKALWAQFCKLSRGVLVGDRARHILGDAIHCDTGVFHGDLVVTRQMDGHRVGKSGLSNGGPWLVGVDRQLRAGATISQEKRERFKRSAESHFQRHGKTSKPCDLILARLFDAVAERMIGPELEHFRKEYAASVPDRERRNAQSKLAVLDAARAKIASSQSVQKPLTNDVGHY